MSAVELTIDADERGVARSDADFVLAHLSDLHLSSLIGVRPRELMDKRILGYLSWRHRRRREHRSDVLDALRADLQEEPLDHIAITGDLTHIGLPREFREAADWLAKLGPPQNVTVVPGNHDAYVRESWHDTFAQWSPYMRADPRGDAAKSDGEGSAATQAHLSDAFPTLRVRRHVALIGLSTALPSAPFLATGRLGERQLARLDSLLAETGASGLFRIVLLHHPPGRHTVRWRKSLRDGHALRDILTRHGAELTLHGHAHFSAATFLDGASRRNLAIGVPSASAIGRHADRHATYHVYRIRREGEGWRLRVAVRAYSLPDHRFVPDDGRRLRTALAAPAGSVP
jgi:3',5'-cyclic AMP phosphodiesterase CpdA